MKTRLLPLIAMSIFFLSGWAQTPQAINYQSIVRNASGNIVANQKIGIRFTILNALTGGNTLYQEKDTATTSALGLFTEAIGNGTVLSGTFAGVNWANGSKYLEVELDINNNGTFASMGTTQLISVPYALVANIALKTAAPAITIDTVFNYLNDNTVTVTATGTKLSTPVMTFNKQQADSKIELQLYSNASGGVFTGGATYIGFYLKLDGAVANYTTSQYFFQSSENGYVNLDAMFLNIPAGVHTASVWGITDTGTSTGVVLDNGGFNGVVTVKEVN